MKRAVLDTHILLWWRQGETKRLSGRQRRLLEHLEKEGEFVVSVISLWEVAKLAAGKRIALALPMDVWMDGLTQIPGLRVEPLSHRIIAASVALENFHRDPADQLIVATALCLGLPLITSDERIRKWEGIITL
ncbi:MAG: type II toxin-antitoxin system VapC family toxin [Bryobacteraceae bacterium]|nr:type II toxin-antitoxin system VapC family toxin [Bryobacteraceae bacterium]